MNCLVQILPKAPNLDQMSIIPYNFDFCQAPRWPTLGTAILDKSKMAAIRVSGQSVQTQKKLIQMLFSDQILQMWYQNDRNK
jgi:hypothetical protein